MHTNDVLWCLLFTSKKDSSTLLLTGMEKGETTNQRNTFLGSNEHHMKVKDKIEADICLCEIVVQSF